MPKENLSAPEVVIKAFETSKGKTKDIVIDHEELPGVTLEMTRWWSDNITTSDRYRMWHPKDHVSFEWEIPPGTDPNVKSIQRAEEAIGEFPPGVMRIRYEDPKTLNIPTVYDIVAGGCQLGPNDEPVSWMCLRNPPGTPKTVSKPRRPKSSFWLTPRSVSVLMTARLLNVNLYCIRTKGRPA